MARPESRLQSARKSGQKFRSARLEFPRFFPALSVAVGPRSRSGKDDFWLSFCWALSGQDSSPAAEDFTEIEAP
jgi:hypothetical protein